MGIDLTVLPVSSETDNGDLICLTAMDICLSSVHGAFMDMKRISVQNRVYGSIADVPENIIDTLFSEDSPYVGGPHQHAYFGEISTCSGQKLRYVLAKDVKESFKEGSNLKSLLEANDEERAAIAYIRELSDDTKIVLYWW